jgi:hypothetical protein
MAILAKKSKIRLSVPFDKLLFFKSFQALLSSKWREIQKFAVQKK